MISAELVRPRNCSSRGIFTTITVFLLFKNVAECLIFIRIMESIFVEISHVAGNMNHWI